MKVLRAFQLALIFATIVVVIVDARNLIVHDRSSRWSFLLSMALFATIFVERYIQRKRQKAVQGKGILQRPD